MGLKKAFSLLIVLILSSTQPLRAQLVDNSAIERFERELDQVRIQTRNQVNTDVPAEQRLLVDYGASLTLSYAAIDDSDYHTHQFNQYQLIGFARLNLDGAHNFFVRASSTYRDFHPASDSFDNHGDDWEEFKIDRAVYRFDLSKFMSAYDASPSIPMSSLKAVGSIFTGSTVWFSAMNLMAFNWLSSKTNLRSKV